MSVAKSYARALFEATHDKNLPTAEVDRIEADLRDVGELVDTSREVRMSLVSPATSAKEKETIIAAIAEKKGSSRLLSQFLVLMASKRRLDILSAVAEAFASVRLESDGGVLGQIVSADPMSSTDLEDLSRAFSAKLGKKVAFKSETDSELLAGMKVSINGVTYDGTLRSQLRRLRDRIALSQ